MKTKIFMFLLLLLLILIGVFCFATFGSPQLNKYMYLYQAYTLDRGKQPSDQDYGIPSLASNEDAVKYLKVPDKFTGIWRVWYQTGQLAFQCEYKDGKRNGYLQTWGDKGMLIIQQHFKNDQLDRVSIHWNDGGIDFLAFCEEGNLVGSCVDFHDDGVNIKNISHYVGGKKNIGTVEFNTNGNILKQSAVTQLPSVPEP